MSKVAIIRCESYDPDIVYEAVKKGIDLLGGIKRFIKKGEKVLLKPNNLSGNNPEKAVTTHPTVFEAIAKILKSYNVTYGDSPGFGDPETAANKSGFKKIAKKYNIKFGDFKNGKIAHFPDGIQNRKFDIANAALEADAIINIPKMKSHALTHITGAVKNMFGCIYGLKKAAFHVKLPSAYAFSKMLVDLNNLLKPRLTIMDAIVAMEGNGPQSGDPVKMNAIIISADPVAVDATFCRLIDLDPKYIPTNTFGQASGLGTYEDIQYLGDPIDSFINKKFNIKRKPIVEKKRSITILKSSFIPRPVIDKEKCIKCGICITACPVEGKALQFKDKDKPPVYDYKKCIRCYCCQEMCPHKAIYVNTPFLGKLLNLG